MTTETAPAGTPRAGIDWRRAEFVLTLLGFLGFITVLIQVRTVPGDHGLPAHPLIIHVPVVMIPLSILGALACVVRPTLWHRFGILVAVGAIIAMSSIFLAMRAGSYLQGALHLQGEAASLINRHSSAADKLAITFVAFTAVLILTFSAYRISGGSPTGLGIVDRALGSPASYLALRVVLTVLALVCAYLVYKVGDLGARAVWEGRLHHGAAGLPPGPPPGG